MLHFSFSLYATCYEVGELSRCVQEWSKPLWEVDHFGLGPCWLGEVDHFVVEFLGYDMLLHGGAVRLRGSVSPPSECVCLVLISLLVLVVASCLKKLIFYETILTTEPRTIDKFWAQSSIFFKRMSSWCAFLNPHLSYIGVQFKHLAKLGHLSLPTTKLGTVS